MFGQLGHEEVALSYTKELDRQSRIIALFASFISLTWLLYIPIDIKLNEYPDIIIFLRIGLTVVGIISLIILFIPHLHYRNLIALMFYASYLLVATAVITGLSGGNPAYIGGYLFILMLLAVAPLPVIICWFLLIFSYSI